MEFKEYLSGYYYKTLVNLWNEFCLDCDYGDESKYIFDGIWDMQGEAFALYGFDEKEFLFALLNGNVERIGGMLYVENGLIKEVFSLIESPINLNLLVDWMIDTDHPIFADWYDNNE